MISSSLRPFASLAFVVSSLVAVVASTSGCPVHKWDQEVQDWREQQKVPGATNNGAPSSSAPAPAPSNGGTMVIPGGGAPAPSTSAKPGDTKL